MCHWFQGKWWSELMQAGTCSLVCLGRTSVAASCYKHCNPPSLSWELGNYFNNGRQIHFWDHISTAFFNRGHFCWLGSCWQDRWVKIIYNRFIVITITSFTNIGRVIANGPTKAISEHQKVLEEFARAAPDTRIRRRSTLGLTRPNQPSRCFRVTVFLLV